MEPVLWHVEFNGTGWHELSKWEVAEVFTICEQAYIYGCLVLCLFIYILVAVKLRSKSHKMVAGKNSGKSDGARREHKVLIQSFLITIILSSVRALVVLMKFFPGDSWEFKALVCSWTIFVWAHHALTPVICTVMSVEIQELLFFWRKRKVQPKGSVQSSNVQKTEVQ